MFFAWSWELPRALFSQGKQEGQGGQIPCRKHCCLQAPRGEVLPQRPASSITAQNCCLLSKVKSCRPLHADSPSCSTLLRRTGGPVEKRHPSPLWAPPGQQPRQRVGSGELWQMQKTPERNIMGMEGC